MAGYVYKGQPVVHTGIVASGQTVKGGQFVTLIATDGTIAPAAKDAADTGVYLVVDVRREDNLPGDDATYAAPAGAMVSMVKLLPGMEANIPTTTGKSAAVGTAVGIGANGDVDATATVKNYIVVGKDPYLGLDAVQIRRLEVQPAAASGGGGD